MIPPQHAPRPVLVLHSKRLCVRRAFHAIELAHPSSLRASLLRGLASWASCASPCGAGLATFLQKSANTCAYSAAPCRTARYCLGLNRG
eukprot:6208720-Pleurochrysis_carterae.AAC.1